jgi:hypothetical protein
MSNPVTKVKSLKLDTVERRAFTMDIIGHDSKEISAVYTHIESSAKRSAMDKLPDITKV